jgi:hypothetical protein
VQNRQEVDGPEMAVVLRPGVAVPVLGYTGAVACAAGAVVLAIVAHAGLGGMPPRGDWRAIGDRLLAGEVLAVVAWGMYKLGSMRIVLGASAMRIVTWGVSWTVLRDEVSDVKLRPSQLVTSLADGSSISPSMFWSSPFGVIYFKTGLFRNSMSREAIREKILQWREEPVEVPEVKAKQWGRVPASRRRWRVRANLPLLFALVALIAAEAAAVTAWW